MHATVESMFVEIREAAKQEMRDMKENELGSWQNFITVADGTWQTRGWHSKNATLTIRNYLNGTLLYYHHICQKGRDEVIQEEFVQRHLQIGGRFLGPSYISEGQRGNAR